MKIVPQIDTYPAWVRAAQTTPGKLALLALFGVELRWLRTSHWPAVLALLAAIVLAPGWRWRLASGGTLAWIFVFTVPTLPWSGIPAVATGIWWQRGVVAAIFVVFLCAGAGMRRYPRSFPARHPVIALLLGCALLLAAAAAAPPGRIQLLLWSLMLASSCYVWFAAYALAEPAADLRGGVVQLGSFTPFWYGAFATSVPIPKGSKYLRRIEVKNSEEAAIMQLKAVKLLAWTVLLRVATILVMAGALGTPFVSLDRGFQRLGWGRPHLGIPSFDQCLAHSVAGHPDPWLWCWASLLVEFWLTVVNLAIWSNVLVAGCRMAGFRALRNTYKPFYARSINDFFNRYYFYFKELLVEFFFYPTYLRCFKRHKRLRLLFATFLAAGFGNAVFHFLRDIHFAAAWGLWRAATGFQVYLFYCLALSLGIGCSQLLTSRAAKRAAHAPPGGWRRALAPLRVTLFFCLLSVFDNPAQRLYPLSAHLKFLLALLPFRLR